MQAIEFWKAVIVDRSNFLESLIALLTSRNIRYSVIGGQGVNAYCEPLVSLDLDLVVSAGDTERLESLLKEQFSVDHFPHSLNVSQPGSDLRVQIQTDPRYFAFTETASVRSVLGLMLPVARLEDILQGKIWAVTDTTRRPTKRQKDLLDIARMLEAYPALRTQVPADILERVTAGGEV